MYVSVSVCLGYDRSGARDHCLPVCPNLDGLAALKNVCMHVVYNVSLSII